MEQDKQTDAVPIHQESGFGIFKGPLIEVSKGCLYFVLLACWALFLFVLYRAINKPSDKWLVILLAICALITIFASWWLIKNIRAPKKLQKTADVDGFWFSNGKIGIGEMVIEFEKEIYINDIYWQESVNLAGLQWKDAKNAQLPMQDSEIVFQLMNSKFEKNLFRIARVHISNGDKEFVITLVGENRPTIINNGKLYMCKNVPLAKQFSILSEMMKTSTWELPGKILITPRDGYGAFKFTSHLAISLLTGSGGYSTFPAPRGKNITGIARKAYETGEFVDKETSQVFLDFTDIHKWEIELRPIEKGEFGLAHTEW